MTTIKEIKDRWQGTPPWEYQEYFVVNPNELEGRIGRQFPRPVAQFFDKAEDDFKDYEINGPKIAAAPTDIATLLIEVELSHELLRELRKVVLAGIFGIPAEESARLRKLITARLEGQE